MMMKSFKFKRRLLNYVNLSYEDAKTFNLIFSIIVMILFIERLTM